MGLFSRDEHASPPPSSDGIDWSLLESIRAEWPLGDFDSEADLTSWREGMQLYESRDDYASMIRAGGLMCRALRYELYGTGILIGGHLPETTHRVMFSSCFPPPDGRSFPKEVAAQVRLGLSVVKKHGWQSSEQGGDGLMAKFLEASHMILTTAVAPSPDHPWEGDIQGYFTKNPFDIPEIEADPVAPLKQTGESRPTMDADAMIDDLYGAVTDAKGGDPAAEARVAGMSAAARGDAEAALREYETAAQMGDASAAFDAALTAEELGLKAQAQHWYETAAAHGHGPAAFNLGVAANEARDSEGAARWLKQAADANVTDAYAALTQLASDAGDRGREMHWSRLGAGAGQPFCQMRYAQLLMQDHPADKELIVGQAIPLLRQAAEKEVGGALLLIGVGYGQIGDGSNARLWLKRAETAGETDATRIMRENGLA